MEPGPPSPEPLKPAADALQELVSGPLATATARVAGPARGIPFGRDFHFYDSFPEFKSPAREVSEKSETLLKSIAASGQFWGRKGPPPLPDDLDEAFDWLVSLNDDFLERFGVSMDEFKNLREKEEENGTNIGSLDSEDGFQLVYGKKKKKEAMRENERDEGSLASGVKVATKDKKTTGGRSKVPFHIPNIPRPQDQYSILVNNKNQPFEHVWLEKSEDGSRFIHPMEKLSVLDFVDRYVEEGEPVKPLSLENTPFQIVEGVRELKELAAKLRNVNEFAVDLEHNQYRSFQGLTCLMQISTRTEDFIIDTLKLRIHVGPYLREVFKDPGKRKVMHGADRDILWLQRDFGIYVCNLFDTGQGSRLLQLERNSLEYLLHHFCGVTANKEYQNADWRFRPLPDEMVKYAREDTHYLLHIYDLMKSSLLSASSNENDLLLEVYRRSSEICMQLYEKELLKDTSYLHIYGLQEANFNSKQLAVVAGLCEWRDNVARAEDESTGYVLPNKVLLEIARQLPVSSGKLRWLVKSKHPFVERYLSSVISIIRSSIANASAFENVAEQIKTGHTEALNVQSTEAADFNSESVPAVEDPMESMIAQSDVPDGAGNISKMQCVEPAAATTVAINDCSNSTDGMSEKDNLENGSAECLQSVKKASTASVQMLKKPTGAFGAMLGHSSSRKKLNSYGGATIDQAKSKVEQIRSTVALPFQYFSGAEKTVDPSPEVDMSNPQPEILQESPNRSAEPTMFEDVIPLENKSDNSQSPAESPRADDNMKHRNWFPPLLPLPQNDLDGNVQPASDAPMSPSDLTSSFERCFQSINQRADSPLNQKPFQEPEVNFQLKPFDYAAARKTMKFGEVEKDEPIGEDGQKAFPDSREKRKSLALSRGHEERAGFQQPRRRQAFPPSGNRTTTYH